MTVITMCMLLVMEVSEVSEGCPSKGHEHSMHDEFGTTSSGFQL